MIIKAYISALGDEEHIRDIHALSALPGSFIKHYDKITMGYSMTGKEKPWGWNTQREPISPEDFDGGLYKFLENKNKIFPFLKKYKENSVYISINIIVKYDNEEPRGFFVSKKTISLINEIGAALDIDVVGVME